MRTIVLLCVAALALSACQKPVEERAAETVIEEATGDRVEIKNGGEQVTLRSDDGTVRIQSGSGLKLPDTFPKDVWLPGKYEVQSVVEAEDGMMIALNVPGDLRKTYEDAVAVMKGHGWHQVAAMQADADSRMLIYEKGKRNATMSLAHLDDGVQVSVHLAEEKD